jgi:hypothetical protein
MKKKTNYNLFIPKALTAFAVLCLLVANPVWANNNSYDLSWSSIDGGGGISSGGQYTVIGTIGQPDAAYSESGSYELLGGFWPNEPLCVVDFEHFAKFVQYWLETGEDLPADLYKDEYNIVDYLDLNEFVSRWLWYCPLGWSLK